VGILRRRRDGNRIYYSSDPACPFLGELRGILLKTVGLVDIVKEALEPFEDLIEVAFIYGSMARGEESAVSDIDLMIIGEIRLAKLAPILRDMEKRLLKPINVVLYARDEFYNKARIGHHFIVEVLKSEKIFLRGNQHELDIASGRAEGKAAHHELQ
jgi:predicted nucleotidyltransferase